MKHDIFDISSYDKNPHIYAFISYRGKANETCLVNSVIQRSMHCYYRSVQWFACENKYLCTKCLYASKRT